MTTSDSKLSERLEARSKGMPTKTLEPNPLALRLLLVAVAVVAPLLTILAGWAWTHFNARLDSIEYQLGKVEALIGATASCPALAEEARSNESRIKTLQDQVNAMNEVAEKCSEALSP